MAERRMFAKNIVLSDDFLDMPMSARCLYFTLGMLADDDGFVNSPRSIMRQCGCTNGDMQELIRKQYVLLFESGVIVIRHWRMNNYLRNDRYHETKCEEKNLLVVDDNETYSLKSSSGIPSGIPSGNPGKDSLGKDSLGKDSLGKDSLGKDSLDNSAHEAEPKNRKTEILESDKPVKKSVYDKRTNQNMDFDKAGFDAFWAAYPKKKAKAQAEKAWKKLNPSIELQIEMGKALEKAKKSRDWNNNDGQYIPYASTWLNNARWTDEDSPRSKQIDERFESLFGGFNNDQA
jgi:hypothetical protein